jgi:hypothetical protein
MDKNKGGAGKRFKKKKEGAPKAKILPKDGKILQYTLSFQLLQLIPVLYF